VPFIIKITIINYNTIKNGDVNMKIKETTVFKYKEYFILFLLEVISIPTLFISNLMAVAFVAMKKDKLDIEYISYFKIRVKILLTSLLPFFLVFAIEIKHALIFSFIILLIYYINLSKSFISKIYEFESSKLN
jgi:hypothetical protein